MTRPAAIWNRDSILELLTRELARAKREDARLTVILAGVDQYQTIRSQQGESRADQAVGEIAKRLTSQLRPYDYVGRYSADQLLLIAPGCEPETVLPLAEKLRRTVSQSPIEANGARVSATISLGLTIAAGIAHIPGAEELLRELELAVGRAQAKGGDHTETLSDAPITPRRRAGRRLHVRIPIVLGCLLLAGILSLYFLAPSWLCTPFLLGDIIDPGELPPPLPVNCIPTSEKPPESTLQSLEAQRQAQGLILQDTMSCTMTATARSNRANDQQWKGNFYGGTLQYRRHVLITESHDIPGGTFVTVEICLVPWWKYIDEAQTSCWERAAFWR